MNDVNKEIKELPDLTPDLIEILGRPNFHCAALANALRLKGHDIPRKSEHEQAAVVHFTLNKYLEDPTNWRDLVRNDLLSGFVQNNGRMAFGTVHHDGKMCALIEVVVKPREGVDIFEPFTIKAIFPKPYVLEQGIFFDDNAKAATAIVQHQKAGEVFNTTLLPEGWMTYDQFFEKLEKQQAGK